MHNDETQDKWTTTIDNEEEEKTNFTETSQESQTTETLRILSTSKSNRNEVILLNINILNFIESKRKSNKKASGN